MKKLLLGSLLSMSLMAGAVSAAEYKVDIPDQHAFISFKVNHIGFSFIHGNFRDFNGSFTYDADKPEASTVNIEINTRSVDTNHAERDKHLRSPDFLNTGKHPKATFKSTSVEVTGEATMNIHGNLTLNGVTQPIVIETVKVGEGQDPWGGYRVGFEGRTSIQLKDFKVKMDMGPAVQSVDFLLSLEGIRQ